MNPSFFFLAVLEKHQDSQAPHPPPTSSASVNSAVYYSGILNVWNSGHARSSQVFLRPHLPSTRSGERPLPLPPAPY